MGLAAFQFLAVVLLTVRRAGADVQARAACAEDALSSEGAEAAFVSLLQQGLKIRSASSPKAGADWVLFPEGQVPLEQPNLFTQENVYGPPDSSNLVGLRCAPGMPNWWYYNVTVPTLTPFLVSQQTPGRTDAAVVVLPGGGFDFLAWETEGLEVAKWLNSIGVSAFVLRYRVPARKYLPGEQAALIDGQRAMKVVRSRAEEFGLNKHRIGVIGFSAGGTLAQLITHVPTPRYTRVDDVDDVSHRPDFQILMYPGPITPDKYAFFAAPPSTFIGVAEDDQCTPPELIIPYYQWVKAKGSPPSEMHVYAHGRHGYGTCTLWLEHQNVFQPVCEWTLNLRFFLYSEVLQVLPGGLNFKMAGASVPVLDAVMK